MIPGRYGRIESGGQELAVYTDPPRLFEKLLQFPGVRPCQVGDHERRATVPPEILEAVAAVIRARRRRALSSEELCPTIPVRR